MTRTLISTGLPGTGDGGLFTELARRVRSGRQDFLLLVPTRRMARRFEMDLLEAGVRCFVRPRVQTLNDFAIAAAQSLFPERLCLRDTDRMAFLAALLTDRSLPWRVVGGGSADFPGTIRAVGDTIARLRSARISPDTYLALASLDDDNKAHDIALAYRRYVAFLASEQLLDTEEAFRLTAEASPAALAAGPLHGVTLLCLLGFYDLTASEALMVSRLVEIVPEVRVVVDYEPTRVNIFAPTARFLELFPGAKHKNRPAPPWPLPGRLFGPVAGHYPSNGRVVLLEADVRTDEVEAVAAEIKRLAQIENVPLRDIGVTFGNVEIYAPLVRETFPRFGIEFNFAHGFYLNRSPVVAAAFNLIQAVLSNYHRRAVIALLQSPYVRFERDGRRLDPEALDTAAREAGIVDRRETWAERLRQRGEALRRTADAIARGQGALPEGEDCARAAEQWRKSAAQYDRMADDVAAMLGELALLEAPGSLDDFCARLQRLMAVFHIPELVVPETPAELPLVEIEKDLRALRRFEGLLNELVEAQRLVRGTTALDLATFANFLRAVVGQEMYQVRTFDDAGVQILSITETRGLRFRHLFILGMLQGEFPALRQSHTFIPEETTARVGLGVRERDLCEERYHFLRLLCAAEARVVLSWPKSEEGQPLVRSPFLDLLESDCGPLPQLVVPDRRCSRDQVIRWAGERLASPAGEEAALVAAMLRANADFWQPIVLNTRTDAVRVHGERSPYAGYLLSKAAQATVATHFGPRHCFSVSQFDRYGHCPFSFFAAEAVGLEPLEEPEEEISPLTRGSIVHELLRWFYTERRRQGKGRPTPADVAEAREALCRRARELYGELPFQDVFQQKELERVIREDGLVDAFLREEVKQAAPLCTQPRFFEFAFGGTSRMGAVDPESQGPPLALSPDVRVVGKIDRVDLDASRRAVVLDYKTGSTSGFSKLADILAGRGFQLPLYLLAVRTALGAQPVAGVYYHVRNRFECGQRVVIARAECNGQHYPKLNANAHALLPGKGYEGTLDDLLEDVRKRALDYADRIRRGEFPPLGHMTDADKCARCEFRLICRASECEQSNLNT